MLVVHISSTALVDLGTMVKHWKGGNTDNIWFYLGIKFVKPILVQHFESVVIQPPLYTKLHGQTVMRGVAACVEIVSEQCTNIVEVLCA
jgi:hypothetical protein